MLSLLRSPQASYESEIEPGNKAKNKTRQPLHPTLRFHILARDERRCTFRSAIGERCIITRGLEIHHIVEVAKGGDDSVENLTTLCSFHHQAQHSHFTISSQKLARQSRAHLSRLRAPTAHYA